MEKVLPEPWKLCFKYKNGKHQFSRSVVSDSLRPHGLQHTRPPCPSPTSWRLLKLMSIESVMQSNHLTLCRPLLLLPSIFPSIRVFSKYCWTLIVHQASSQAQVSLKQALSVRSWLWRITFCPPTAGRDSQGQLGEQGKVRAPEGDCGLNQVWTYRLCAQGWPALLPGHRVPQQDGGKIIQHTGLPWGANGQASWWAALGQRATGSALGAAHETGQPTASRPSLETTFTGLNGSSQYSESRSVVSHSLQPHGLYSP